MSAYTEAVQSGLYAKKTGLVGKYDNVRRYWEDEITRHFIYPHLKRLLQHCRAKLRRLRIMDLGCGSADGLELLMGIRDRDAGLNQTEVDLLAPDILGGYLGIDLNDELIAQAKVLYGHRPKIRFCKADFTKGLAFLDEEGPFDLYFSSYGTTSHHNDLRTLERLLVDIVQATEEYSVVVCDWLGRYSYEWQTLWTDDLSQHCNMNYVVSYIYDKQERQQRQDELQHLTLRLMSRPEIEHVLATVERETGVAVRPLTFFDRSIFTGRHMDTADYNPHAQPTRHAVNSLHEMNVRTDLNSVLVDYVPKPGFAFINQFFEQLQMCWNTLVQYVGELIDSYDVSSRSVAPYLKEIPGSFPPALREMMKRMHSVVEGVGWLGLGLPRENVIEPQLGYALRYLVMKLQPGQGYGHGLVGIFEVNKS